MKRLLFFICMFALLICKAQQTPWTAYDFPLFPISSGFLPLSGPGEVFTPFYSNAITFNQASQVNMTAGERVHLQPGFHAGDYTSNGYFHAYIQQPDFEVVFIEPNEHIPNVGQFEKLEMGLKLPANIEQQINDYINNLTNGINPFDPEQISVEAEFNNGNTSYTIFGFYYEGFSRDPQSIQPFPDGHPEQFTPANWLPVSTNYNWRIRFAPPIIGTWNCSISIRLGNASIFSYVVNNIVFTCVPSSNEGFLKKGNDNWHLAYSGSNTSFFAIGQNIAWNGVDWDNGNVYFRGGNQAPGFAYSGGFMDVLDNVANLADNGGNMTRIVDAPWSFDFEWEHLGNYSNRMNRAWEQDQLFELCEQRKMKLYFCLENALKYGDLYHTDSNTEDGWDANPYHTDISGVDYPDDFLTNNTARKKFKNKLRYFVSRWGYSTSLGVFELLSEMDYWHYSVGRDQLINFPNLQQQQLNWHTEMLQYVKLLLNYRPILTSTSHSHPGRDYTYTPFYSDEVDITNNHPYQNERTVNLIRFHEFNRTVPYLQGTHAIWSDKPTIFEEMGLAGGSADQGDIEQCNDISYHNSLWAAAFMGGFGTSFYWYNWSSNNFRQANFPALKVFFDGVDFQNRTFKDPDFWDDAPFTDFNHSTSRIETFYIRDDHARRVMGWVHNTTYWWGNIAQNCTDRHGNVLNITNDFNDDTPSSPQSLPFNTVFEVHGLHNLFHYNLDWYYTRTQLGFYQQFSYLINIFGTMKPTWPGVEADWAFKAYRSDNSFREGNEITSDTLLCWQDTIVVNGNHENDMLGKFHYHWNFGNGQVSNDRNTIAVYSQSGTYLVTLIVSDSLGWSDTLRQYIVKPTPCASAKLSSLVYDVNSGSSWNAFPNPASNNLTLTFDSSWSSTVSVELYSLDGRCVVSQSVPLSSDKEIPLAQLNSGVYLLRVKDDKHTEVKRIIIEH